MRYRGTVSATSYLGSWTAPYMKLLENLLVRRGHRSGIVDNGVCSTLGELVTITLFARVFSLVLGMMYTNCMVRQTDGMYGYERTSLIVGLGQYIPLKPYNKLRAWVWAPQLIQVIKMSNNANTYEYGEPPLTRAYAGRRWPLD
ncbi:hypothetical protein CLF_101405 [Clonorchis sinensis]|uniref:Uncharacterized protein n=1 Tax=Clonorchis sinensis TaxID=79923 RepID=G7Y5P0_CLOSI|nr:hypothetical protein CLF_101405 [Clonorchis sinensis]